MKVKKVNLEKYFKNVPECFGRKKYGYALTNLSRRDIEKGLHIPEKANYIADTFLSKLPKEQQPVSIEIPAQIVFIERRAFKYSNIERVVMNWHGVKEIGRFCFAESKIQHLVLSDEIRFIPEGMCFGCKDLESITIPNSATSISEEAFRYCSNLKNVVLGQRLRKIEDFAFAKTALEEVDIPASVKTLGLDAFAGCANLKKVVLHEGLKEISVEAFLGTAIEEIVIPKSVECLDLEAFRYCSNLKKIRFAGFNPKLHIKGICLSPLDDESWLSLLTYSASELYAIPEEKFKDEKFVADCRDAIVKGMKARDRYFGLTEERMLNNMEILYEANVDIDWKRGKLAENHLQEKNQQIIETFKAGKETTQKTKDK